MSWESDRLEEIVGSFANFWDELTEEERATFRRSLETLIPLVRREPEVVAILKRILRHTERAQA